VTARAGPLAGRRAIVTGGGTGIGRAIALALAGGGAAVAIGARRPAPLQATLQELRALGGPAHAFALDVTRRAAAARALQRACDALGGLDVLVNNAGAGGPNGCALPGPDRWDEVVRTNLDGTFHCTTAVVARIGDGGRIVNVSSVLGRFGVPGYTAYCASKTGLIGFTRALALELAPRRITVNAVCPGWTETEMARTGMELLAEATGTTYAKARRQALAAVPLQRIAQPEEIGALVAYLCSPAAGGMTGQAIALDGGATMV
jgi:NAD(P)-dependent dehydrogenase (short-subunit alcohol dehydrogenase family)